MGKSNTKNGNSRFPILKKPPIVEATFQLNFAMKAPMADTEAKSFVQNHFDGYKFKEDFFSESIAVKKKGVREPPESITHHQNWIGARFSKDNNVVTIFSNGFAFGVLKPYPSDESFFKDIFWTTKLFEKCFSNLTVTRIGLRFINSFPVNTEGHAPSKLFSTIPSSPSKIGYGDPIQFLHQNVLQDRETGVIIVSNCLYPSNGTETPHEPKAVLDIDASMTPNRDLAESDFENAVADLRYAVNKTFFGTVRKPILEEMK